MDHYAIYFGDRVTPYNVVPQSSVETFLETMQQRFPSVTVRTKPMSEEQAAQFRAERRVSLHTRTFDVNPPKHSAK